MFGSAVTTLIANKAYYIPDLIIDGFESKKLKGVGVTNTVESVNDGSEAFRCTVNIDDNRVNIVPNKDIQSGYEIAVQMICFII